MADEGLPISGYQQEINRKDAENAAAAAILQSQEQAKAENYAQSEEGINAAKQAAFMAQPQSERWAQIKADPQYEQFSTLIASAPRRAYGEADQASGGVLTSMANKYGDIAAFLRPSGEGGSGGRSSNDQSRYVDPNTGASIATRATSAPSSGQLSPISGDVPMAGLYNMGIAGINAAREPGATQSSVQSAVGTYNATAVAAPSTQLSPISGDVPMAGLYNMGIAGINAAREPGATQSSVQESVRLFNDYSSQYYNPQKADVIQRFYVPEGNYVQQELSNIKLGGALDAYGRSTGEAGWYKQLEGGRMNIDPNTGQLSNWMLIGGGGRNFMQSGTAGFVAATSAVYAEGRVGQKEFTLASVVAPDVAKSGITANEIIASVKAGTAGELFSRLGAEAYGGVVRRQDNRVLGNVTYEDVSNRAAWNLASYVNPTDVNLSKADLPGVSIPWSITDTAPAFFALTTKGGVGAPIAVKSFDAFVGKELTQSPATYVGKVNPGTVVAATISPSQVAASMEAAGYTGAAGSAAVANVKGDRVGITPTSPAGVEIAMAEGGLPKPFIAPGISAKTIQPTGDIFGYNIPLISPAFALFQPSKTISETTSYKQLPVSTSTEKGTPYVIGDTTYFPSTVTTTGGTQRITQQSEVQNPSAFDSFLGNANVAVSKTLGLDKLPIPTAEQYKQFAPQISLLPFAAPIGIALQTPVVSDYAASYLKGEGEALLTKPGNAAAAYGAGFALGIVGKGVEVGYGSARVSFAAKAITEGGGWRAAEQYAANVPKAAGLVLGGAYAVSVAARTTNMGTDFSPASTERLGGIMGTEAIPGGLGFIAGMGTPSAVYNAARVSDIGYKASVQEGTTIGRFDYYVKQPVTKPYELAKIDYKAYQQEGGNGLLGYAVERAGFNTLPEAAPTTLKYIPGETGQLAELAYGKQNTIFDYLTKGTYESPTTLKYAPSENPMGAQAEMAYGKPSNIFDMFDATVAPEPTTLKYVPAESGEIATLAYPKAQQPLSMRIASYLQENKPFENLQINLRYPAKEIAQTNKLSADFNKAYSGKDVVIREPITPLSKTFSSLVKSNVGRTPSPYNPSTPTSESIGSGGQVSVSVSSLSEPISSPVMDTGWRGTPEYPLFVALLAPRQKYQIEEETQYLTLPPGMISPSPQKTSTITYSVPMQDIATQSKSAMSEVSTNISVQRLVYQPVSTEISGKVKTEPLVVSITNTDLITERITKQTPFQDFTTRQTTRQIITPVVTPITDQTQNKITKTITPIIPLLPPFPPFFGGGGGGGGARNPRGPRHTEIFTYAPKNLKGLYGMPKGRTPAIKKKRK